MSDFWSRALGAPANTPPVNHAPPPQGTPWWRLPTYQSADVPSGAAAPPPGPLDVHPLTGAPIPPRLPQSAQQADTCPSCGSGNYGKAQPSSPARCFDCNYGLDRAQHSTAGMRGNSRLRDETAAPAKRALGQSGGKWQPKTIIGRIG